MEVKFTFLEALSFLNKNKYIVNRSKTPGDNGYFYQIKDESKRIEITDQKGVVSIAQTVAIKQAKIEIESEESYLWAL